MTIKKLIRNIDVRGILTVLLIVLGIICMTYIIVHAKSAEQEFCELNPEKCKIEDPRTINA